MGFPPPLPVYLDLPTTWRQELSVLTSDNHSHLPPSLPPSAAAFGGGPGPGSVRPTSMAERARLAKLPQPEETLKCPRCNSTNTKFCYFNNYSLSQPRHFCKTCRRYWTRGGALRNVPVGGGCRRNKRSKRNRSKSPSSVNQNIAVRSVVDVRSHLNVPQQLHSLPFLSAPPPTLQDYNHGGISLDGLFLPPHTHVGAQGRRIAGDFQMGGDAETGVGTGCREAVIPENWEMQQFPFLGSCGGLPDTEGGFFCGVDEQGRGKMDEGQWQMGSSASSREVVSISGNNQYWGGWSGISGFPSSSSATSLH